MTDSKTPTQDTSPDAQAAQPDERARMLLQRLVDGFNMTPFMQHIGARVSSVGDHEIRAVIDMQPCLVGNVFQQILHGGVIATLLDTVGGAAALMGAYTRLKGQPREEKMRRMAQLGTIDMRIDYLRPGRGTQFEAVGRVVRAGGKICATQMELRNQDGELIATGNAVFHY
ncbi:MAG: thioesterase family protein [Perlucidibaca sp.]